MTEDNTTEDDTIVDSNLTDIKSNDEKSTANAETDQISQESTANSKETSIVPIRRVIPSKLNLIVINQRPLFPHMVVPLVVEGERFLNVIQQAINNNPSFFMISLGKESYSSDDQANQTVQSLQTQVYPIGVVARIVKIFQMNNENAQVLLDIIARAEIQSFEIENKMICVNIKVIDEEKIEMSDSIRAYSREIIGDLKEIIKLNPLVKEEINQFINQINIEDPHRLADFAATLTSAGRYDLQEILNQTKIQPRLEKTLLLIKKELDLSKLQVKISHQIEERINKNQREFFLKEQLKEIKKELGLTKDEKLQEVDKLLAKAKKFKWSKDTEKVFRDELEKLSMLEPQSPEYHVTRNYLDWLANLPWGIYQKENLKIERAKQILERDHFGLDDVKERILNMIASMILKKQVAGKIICLVGPPGVGKTSIGKSIAKSLNRPFYRFSLGGMRDEAEIKGHRRTYIGAMPGKFIQALKVVGKANAVIMLDEIDKINRSYSGDPASALLEVLDPEQNNSFLDHYLDVPFDLSKILFISTANQLDTIPAPLRDRMDIIRISGYIGEEKFQIGKRYLVKKQLLANGIGTKQVKFTDEALKGIVDGYARESGVRDLEKKIESICQQLARIIVEKNPKTLITVTKDDLSKYLKKPIFSDEELIGQGVPGCVNGLAWTNLGGAILTIEAIIIGSDKGGFKQTGQLGKVMVESSEIAYSYILANCKNFNADDKSMLKYKIHLHVPAGATPKDGPSAGVSMALSILSLVLNRAVKPKIGLTGELSLTGEVLPIGGLKEKIIAAKRSGLTEVIFPKANNSDFLEIPKNIVEGLIFHQVSNFKQIVKICLDI